MVRADFDEGRLLYGAMVDGDRAARVKAAALWRVNRAGHIALQDDALALQIGIGDGYGRPERLGIGM